MACVHRYDFHNKNWTSIKLTGEESKIPVARAFHSAVCYNVWKCFVHFFVKWMVTEGVILVTHLKGTL